MCYRRSPARVRAASLPVSARSKRERECTTPAARGCRQSHVGARRDSGVGREAGRRGMRPIRSRRAPQAGWLTPLLILGLFMTGLLGGFGLSRHTRSVAPTLVLPLRESSSHTTLLPPPRIPAPLTAAPPPSPSSPPPSPHPSSPPPSPAPPNVLGEPAEGRILFATFATGAMAEFLLNWVASVRAVGVGTYDSIPRVG